jgi:hypothetical protein
VRGGQRRHRRHLERRGHRHERDDRSSRSAACRVGHERQAAFELDRWLDVVTLQQPLL